MLTLTENAVNQIKKAQMDTNSVDKSLRVAVVGGGCSGNQYQIGFDTEYAGDSKFESGGITVLVDERSAPMLAGIEIDFVESMQGSSFVFNNPNSDGGCGCGKSFSC